MEENIRAVADALFQCGGVYICGNYNLSESEFVALAELSTQTEINAFAVHSRLTDVSWNDYGGAQNGTPIFDDLDIEAIEIAEANPESFKGFNLSELRNTVEASIQIQLDELERRESYEFRRHQACLYTSTPSVRKAVFDRDGKICRHCGSTENLSMDHVIPVSKNGEDSLENLQVLCRSCNSSKGSR